MGYLGLTPASLTALLIGVLGPTQPGVHILLGPVPCEPIILGLIPGIILGLSSADLTIFCLGPDSTTAPEALPASDYLSLSRYLSFFSFTSQTLSDI